MRMREPCIVVLMQIMQQNGNGATWVRQAAQWLKNLLPDRN